MNFRKQSEAVRHSNTEHCIAYEYSHPTTTIDSAVIELTGRYPENGWAMNTVCTSLFYVVQGTGQVRSETGIVIVEKGDQVLIEPGENML